jgi:leader peptidase (prepilin peptidase)/N-methyltransferase
MAVIMALVGAIVGSFVNVVIDRVPARQSLLRPGSHCPSCQRALRPAELVPVFSYVALRGRCRTCDAPIPRRVLLVEVATAVLFAALWIGNDRVAPAVPGGTLWTAAIAVYGCVMIALFVIDLEHRRVPNAIVLPAMGLALVMTPVLAWLAPRYAHYGVVAWVAPALPLPLAALIGQLVGGVAAFGIFWLIWRIAPQGMGAGDVKLAGFVGLLTGFPCALAAVFGSFILGGVVAAVLLLSGRVGRKTAIPFAPFLIVAAFAVMVFGDVLLAWYLRR